ncbi:hypothetical protein MBANPS3_004132 [Mucor bainieri]
MTTLQDIPNEILSHIAEYIPLDDLMQLEQVNHQFRAVAQEQINTNNDMTITLRGTRRVDLFAAAFRLNFQSPFLQKHHLRIYNYENRPPGNNSLIGVLQMCRRLQTLYLRNTNLADLIPQPAVLTHVRGRTFQPLTRLVVDPMPRAPFEQSHYLRVCRVYQRTLQELQLPMIHTRMNDAPPLNMNLPGYLNNFNNLEVLILPFAMRLQLSNILAAVPRLQALRLEIKQKHLIRPLILTPIIHNNLQRLEVSTHLITAELLRFIRLYLRNVTKLRIFGNPRFIGNVRGAIAQAGPAIRSIVHLQLSRIAQVTQFFPHLTVRFPHVRVAHILEGCTLEVQRMLNPEPWNLERRLLNLGAWNLEELKLNLGFAPLNNNNVVVMLVTITGGGQQRLYLWQQTAPGDRGTSKCHKPPARVPSPGQF